MRDDRNSGISIPPRVHDVLVLTGEKRDSFKTKCGMRDENRESQLI